MNRLCLLLGAAALGCHAGGETYPPAKPRLAEVAGTVVEVRDGRETLDATEVTFPSIIADQLTKNVATTTSRPTRISFTVTSYQQMVREYGKARNYGYQSVFESSDFSKSLATSGSPAGAVLGLAFAGLLELFNLGYCLIGPAVELRKEEPGAHCHLIGQVVLTWPDGRQSESLVTAHGSGDKAAGEKYWGEAIGVAHQHLADEVARIVAAAVAAGQ